MGAHPAPIAFGRLTRADQEVRARANLAVQLAGGSNGPITTTISRLRSDGPVVLRPTIAHRPDRIVGWDLAALGAAWVSRAAGAAGPLGGDDFELDVSVGPGAALVLSDVSASVALPGPHRECSASRVAVRVAAGATFVWLPRPLIAAWGCRHRGATYVMLDRGARLLVREEILFGRFGERPGSLRQRLRVCLGDSPLYDQDLAIGPGAAGWDGSAVTGGSRAIGSVLVVDPRWEEYRLTMPATQPDDAVLLPLTGPAVLLSALASDAHGLRRRLDAGSALLGGLATAAAALRGDVDSFVQ